MTINEIRLSLEKLDNLLNCAFLKADEVERKITSEHIQPAKEILVEILNFFSEADLLKIIKYRLK